MFQKTDQEHIIQLLAQSFSKNKAVNFTVRGGETNLRGRNVLMRYAFWNAMHFGEIILSNDKTATALLIDSSRKKYTVGAFYQDLRLVFDCIGIFRLRKVLKQEKAVKKHFPDSEHIYLWFIGVAPEAQGKGSGGEMLARVIQFAEARKLPIYLVTSTERNFSFYEKHGFLCVGTSTDNAFSSRIYAYQH